MVIICSTVTRDFIRFLQTSHLTDFIFAPVTINNNENEKILIMLMKTKTKMKIVFKSKWKKIYAIWTLLLAESPKFLHLIGNRGQGTRR